MADTLPYQVSQEAGYTESVGGAGSSATTYHTLRGTTTDATKTTLYVDNSSSNLLLIPSGQSCAFTVQVVGRKDNGESGFYFIRGGIENVGGTTAIIGSNVADTPMEDTAGWACVVEADNTNDALQVNVTGASSSNVNWTASVILTHSYNVA